MTTLSDSEILEFLREKKLVITNLPADNIQLGSVDLTLGKTVEVVTGDAPIDIEAISKEELKNRTEEVNIEDGYDLKPSEMVTGYSSEKIEMPSDLNGMIVNRNSLAKIGIDAEISQYINPGFSGHKIIVIKNISNRVIRIKAGVRICSLVLFRMGNSAIRSYVSRHDTSKIFNYINSKEMEVSLSKDSKKIDSSLADFMNERIDAMAGK